MGNGCSAGTTPPVEGDIVKENELMQVHTPQQSLHRARKSESAVNIVEFEESGSKDGIVYKGILSPTEFKVFTVREVKQLTHNTKQLRFWLPNGTTLDTPVGAHIQIRALVDGQQVTRNYTPITTIRDKGYFDIIVKSYDNGSLSKHLCQLKVGEAIDVRGPFGKFKYAANSHRTICMIYGGTGVTPLLQVMRTIFADPSDNTKFCILSSNHTEADILCKDELDEYKKKYPSRVDLYHSVSVPTTPNWDPELAGHINVKKIEKYLPPPDDGVRVLVCGSYLFWKAMQTLLLEAKFTKQHMFSF